MVTTLLNRLFATDLALDLGTSATRIFARGAGVVLHEPSVVATRAADGTVIEVGHRAKAMVGRTPDSVAVDRPVRNGVIADLDLAQKLLEHLLGRVPRRAPGMARPRIVVAVPVGVTQVEQRAVRDTVLEAGAGEVYLVEEPLAAAIGAGMPIEVAGGQIIVGIGGGTTQAALLSLSGIVHCESRRTGGDEMDEAIIQWVRKQHNVLVGELQAEAIKLTLGGAAPGRTGRQMQAKGRHLVDGLPKTIVITEEEVADALRDAVTTIVEAVRTCLERTPAELAADVVDTGIVLTGGGALLPGLAEVLRSETRLPVAVAAEPLTCTVLGAGRMLDRVAVLGRRDPLRA